MPTNAATDTQAIKQHRTQTWRDRLEELPDVLGFSSIEFRHETGPIGHKSQMLDPVDDSDGCDVVRWATMTIIGIGSANDDDEHEKETKLGEIRAMLYLFDDALDCGVDIVNASDSDAEAHHAAEVLHALYEDDDYRADLGPGGVGIYIENVFLESAFRRNDLGYVALKRFLDWYAGHAFAILTFPKAEYFFKKGKLALDPLSTISQTSDGQKKLEMWCKRFGFTKHADKASPGFWLLPEHDGNWATRSISKKQGR